MVGYQINRPPEEKYLGHFYSEKINIQDIVVPDETFDRLRVEYEKVYDTPPLEVIRRVDFD